MTKKSAEIAYDLHSGLSKISIPEFEDLSLVGMAATLAIHIKGLPEISYDVLRKVSEHMMGVPSIALKSALEILDDIDFVRIVTEPNSKRPSKIIPNIPAFEDVYSVVGNYIESEAQFNEHERAALYILGELQEAPAKRDALFGRSNLDKSVFDRCLQLGMQSGIVSEHQARGRAILISPFYFTDNLSGLADAAAQSGSSAIKSALDKVKNNQGWPMALLDKRQEIGGSPVNPVEMALIHKLSEEGVIKPPTIKFGEVSQSFLFTPKPGEARLNAANREIYERAMALISAVRKGQLLADQYKIYHPVALLRSFRGKGYLRSNSEANLQYQNLVHLRVATLRRTSDSRWALHLNQTDENKRALDLAIDLLSSGNMAGMEIDQDARIALTKNETYIQSLISASEMKKRRTDIQNTEAEHEFEQLLLSL